jgi:hypothetical protein
MRTATHFDTHQFQKPKFQWAIGAKTGLEFVDFAFHGMHMQFKAQASKHGPPPVWAMDNAALHLLVARFLENRAAIGPIDASIPERIARAEEELKARRPVINDRLDRLAHRYDGYGNCVPILPRNGRQCGRCAAARAYTDDGPRHLAPSKVSLGKIPAARLRSIYAASKCGDSPCEPCRCAGLQVWPPNGRPFHK